MSVGNLPGFDATIKEGGLGVTPPSTAGRFGILGIASSGEYDIKRFSSPSDVEDEYELGSLVEHALDAFAAGASEVVLKRILAAASGTVGSAQTLAKGKATATTGGTAKNSRTFTLKIVGNGAFDDVKYKLSENGGISYGDELSFEITEAGPPKKSKIQMANGSWIELTEDTTPADSFVDGDEWEYKTTEAAPTNQEVVDTATALAEWKDASDQGLAFIEVVPAAEDTLWASLATIADNIWTSDERGLWFLCNARYLDAGEDVDTWLAALETMSGNYRHARIAACAAHSLLVDGHADKQVRAAGGAIAGLVSKAKLHHSVGWVREYLIAAGLSVYPYYPQVSITGEVLGTGDGAQVTFSGTLTKYPVRKGSLSITDTVETFNDNRDGTLTGSAGGTGTIDYDTGAYSVTFNTAPVMSQDITADYIYIDQAFMNLTNIATLNDARFITVRQWTGYGFCPTDDWMMAPVASDYYCIRNRRIIDEAVRGVKAANMPFVNSPGISKEDMLAYQKALETPLDAIQTEENIVSYDLTLTPDAEIWSNGIVHCTLEVVPTPTKKKLKATFQLKKGG